MHTLIFFAFVLCSAAAASAQDQTGNQSAEYPSGPGAIPLLQEIWKIGADRIYPATLADRFDAGTLKQLEAKLRSDESAALADVLNPFLDSLGVSHTQFYDRRHQTYYLLRSLFATRDLDAPELYTVGVQLDHRSPGLVRAVLEGSPAAAGGIRRGERIVAVDGVPFESVLQWQRAEVIRLTVENRAGRREVELKPIRQSFHRALARATEDSRRVIDCDGRRIGYFHLWSGTHDVFLSALSEAVLGAADDDLDGMILDLRDGYGGAWFPYLDPFFSNRDEYFVATVRSRDDPIVLRPESQNNPDAWRGPLAVIINGGTRSGKESLAYQFRKTGRARLFGTTTAGAFTGGLGVFMDRDEGYAFYLSVRELLLDGNTLEGVGVSPGVVVPEDDTHDAPLAASLKYLDCNTGPGYHNEQLPLSGIGRVE